VIDCPVLTPGDRPSHYVEVEQLVKLIVREVHAQMKKDDVRRCVSQNLVELNEAALVRSVSFIHVSATSDVKHHFSEVFDYYELTKN
jgi:hypothetical protein